MSDMISRQEALEFIDYLLSQPCEDGKEDFVCGMRVGYYRIRIGIKYLPSAQPRKKGKWIDEQCSICGCDVPAYIIDWKWQKDMDANYCPSCGADMRGDSYE